MKDIPIFTGQFGIGTLILREIPYRKYAYVMVRSAQEGRMADVYKRQAVKKGQILLILEAMKMENEIVAPRDGTVAQIVTSKGAVVDTGAPLIVLS